MRQVAIIYLFNIFLWQMSNIHSALAKFPYSSSKEKSPKFWSEFEDVTMGNKDTVIDRRRRSQIKFWICFDIFLYMIITGVTPLFKLFFKSSEIEVSEKLAYLRRTGHCIALFHCRNVLVFCFVFLITKIPTNFDFINTYYQKTFHSSI